MKKNFPQVFSCVVLLQFAPHYYQKLKSKKGKLDFWKNIITLFGKIYLIFFSFPKLHFSTSNKKRKKESCAPKKIRNFGFSFEKNLFGFFFAKFDRLPNLTTSLPFLSLCMYRSQKKIFKGIWRVKSETQWFVLKSFFYYF